MCAGAWVGRGMGDCVECVWGPRGLTPQPTPAGLVYDSGDAEAPVLLWGQQQALEHAGRIQSIWSRGC